MYRKQSEEAERQQLLESSSDESISATEGSIELLSDDSRSSGEGTRFAKGTGSFTQDLPPSPKVSKGQGKKISAKGANDVAPTSSQSITTMMQVDSPAPAPSEEGKTLGGIGNEVATNTSFSSADLTLAVTHVNALNGDSLGLDNGESTLTTAPVRNEGNGNAVIESAADMPTTPLETPNEGPTRSMMTANANMPVPPLPPAEGDGFSDSVGSSLPIAGQRTPMHGGTKSGAGSGNKVISTTTDSDSDFDVMPPSGRVAWDSHNRTLDEPHFNILKGRFTCKKSKGKKYLQ